MKRFFTLFFLLFFTSVIAQIQIGQDIIGDLSTDSFGNSVDISSDGTMVVIGSGSSNNNGFISNGLMRVYEFNGDQWLSLGNDIYGESDEEGFGASVSISSSGHRIAVSARVNSENGNAAGKVRIFEFIAGQWIQIGNSLFGENPGDQFGQVLSLSDDGNRIAISSPLSDADGTNGGLIRIYEYDNTNWIQLGTDIIGEAPNDRLGLSSISFSSDGNIVAASSDTNNQGGTNSGNVLVHEYNGTEWIQVGSDIDGSQSQDGNRGIYVALSGDGKRLAMGAPGNRDIGSDAGQVRVFELSSGEWEQLGSDLYGDEAFDFYGHAVSLSENGEYLSVCSDTANGTQLIGETNIYRYTNGNWEEISSIIGDGGGYKSMTFNSNANYIIIGNDDYSPSGRVRVFSLSGILSTEDVIDNDDASVFPNPTSDFLTISSSYKIESISLYSVLGKRMKIALEENRINLIEIPNGIYFLKLITNKGIITNKILKNY